jgi:hypothetical protein
VTQIIFDTESSFPYRFQPDQVREDKASNRIVALKERKMRSTARQSLDAWGRDVVGWVCEDVQTGKTVWADEEALGLQLNAMEVLAWSSK